MGDLNGNGVNDILVGYPFLNSIGGAYLIYMNSDNSNINDSNQRPIIIIKTIDTYENTLYLQEFFTD